MEPQEVNKIMNKIIEAWIKKHGINNIDFKKVETIRRTLLMSPYNDGFMRVSMIGEKEKHLVPFEDIILKGLNGKDVKKYPIENNNV